MKMVRVKLMSPLRKYTVEFFSLQAGGLGVTSTSHSTLRLAAHTMRYESSLNYNCGESYEFFNYVLRLFLINELKVLLPCGPCDF